MSKCSRVVISEKDTLVTSASQCCCPTLWTVEDQSVVVKNGEMHFSLVLSSRAFIKMEALQKFGLP